MSNQSRRRPLRWLDKVDFLKLLEVTKEDIEYLRAIYLPEKDELETLLGRKLDVGNIDDSLSNKACYMSLHKM